ncbi:PREDICTED: uncharacterized protein LOC105461797 [Wasmannia auropunctata]|uniref:uncharacterized protein LOC105461797 n=1 Tax=Wasmannia auropunctata TaxID=64793 RepID=UPI0005EF291F|nr:PREDICTED: uncharacterized protein LOC105461797 [Wasmannia auropunctata]
MAAERDINDQLEAMDREESTLIKEIHAEETVKLDILKNNSKRRIRAMRTFLRNRRTSSPQLTIEERIQKDKEMARKFAEAIQVYNQASRRSTLTSDVIKIAKVHEEREINICEVHSLIDIKHLKPKSSVTDKQFRLIIDFVDGKLRRAIKPISFGVDSQVLSEDFAEVSSNPPSRVVIPTSEAMQ